MLVELDVATQDDYEQEQIDEEELEELNIELEGEVQKSSDTEFRTISMHCELIKMVQPYDEDESLIFYGDILPPMHCKHSRKGVHNKINKAKLKMYNNVEQK